MDEFKVNEYISLKLEDNKTFIYIGKERFHKCKYLLLNIPVDGIRKFDEIQSIDEAAELLDKSMESHRNQKIDIPPETEFWGHCSNLQVWAEHDYNTCVLHSNLAFSMLKKLVEVGDPKAKKVFKDEIAERFSAGHIPVMLYLVNNGYLKHLNKEEIKTLIEQWEDDPEKIATFLESQRDLFKITLDIFAKGKNLPYIKKVADSVELEKKAMYFYKVGRYIANVKMVIDEFQSQVVVKMSKDSNIKVGIQLMELAMNYSNVPERLFEILPHLYGFQNRWDKAIILYEKAIEQYGIKPLYITGMFMAAFYAGRQDIIDKYLEESIQNREVLEDPYSFSNVLYSLNRKETKKDSKTALKLLKIYWNSLKFSSKRIAGLRIVTPKSADGKLIPSLLVNMTDTFLVADVMNETFEEIVQNVLKYLNNMHPVIYENLAWYYLKKQQIDEAIKSLKKAKAKGHPEFDSIKSSNYFSALKDNPDFLKLFD